MASGALAMGVDATGAVAEGSDEAESRDGPSKMRLILSLECVKPNERSSTLVDVVARAIPYR